VLDVVPPRTGLAFDFVAVCECRSVKTLPQEHLLRMEVKCKNSVFASYTDTVINSTSNSFIIPLPSHLIGHDEDDCIYTLLVYADYTDRRLVASKYLTNQIIDSITEVELEYRDEKVIEANDEEKLESQKILILDYIKNTLYSHLDKISHIFSGYVCSQAIHNLISMMNANRRFILALLLYSISVAIIAYLWDEYFGTRNHRK
jgi:hypothetical protein